MPISTSTPPTIGQQPYARVKFDLLAAVTEAVGVQTGKPGSRGLGGYDLTS